jgi:hypothetical protein
MWGRRLRQYDYCLDELEKAWTELTAMDHYLLTSYTYVHQLGETALRYLHEAGYEQMVRQTAQFGRVAFQSFGQGYFRWNEQMRPLLGGEWNWVLDMRARDIGQWLKAESRRNGWRDEEAIRFLDGYNSVSPLLEREYAVIYALLLYPGRFLKLVETYQQLPPEERQEVDGEAWQAQLEAEMERMEVALRRYPQAIMQQYGVSIPQIDWLWRYEDEKTESAGNEKNRG